jgi:hypothetical protein
MRVYNNVFYLLFKVLKSFEAGLTHQTDSNRSFEVVMVMSRVSKYHMLKIPTLSR